MTRDEIVRMAQEAAIMPPNWGATENQWRTLHDFAALVAADEREACAKVCEKAIASIWEYGPEEIKQAGTNVCNNLAAAIRARGQA